MNHFNSRPQRRALTLLCLLPLFLFLAGCSSSSPNISGDNRVRFPGEDPAIGSATAQPLPSLSGDDGSNIAIGDDLTISFSDVPPGQFPPQVQVKVGNDGEITLPHNRRIRAVGKTANDLSRDIRDAYVPSLYVNLTAVVKTEPRYYFVGGEVKVSSRQIYTGSHITVLRAIDTASGFTEFAKRTKIEVRRANGKTVWVNWEKARRDPRLDLPVFPNDQIIVHKKVW
jgi:protein involved in polysaccharide export with SLBB domain